MFDTPAQIRTVLGRPHKNRANERGACVPHLRVSLTHGTASNGGIRWPAVFQTDPQCAKYGLSHGKANDNPLLTFDLLQCCHSFVEPPSRELARSMIAVVCGL